MAQAKVVDSRLCRIWINNKPGDPGTPGDDTDPPAILICALTTKGFNQTKNTNTAIIPDCDDPTIVAPVKRTPISLDATISGDGYYEPQLRNPIQKLFDSSVSTKVYFEISNGADAPLATAGYYSGKFFLTTLNITADEGQYVRCAMTWEVDGEWGWDPSPFAATLPAGMPTEMPDELDKAA